MDITALPTKILYSDPVTNYRVISCRVMGHQPNDFELNSYNNFTISGNNISFLKLGETCDVSLVKDENSKYPASYRLAGLRGISVGLADNVDVDPRQEYSFLCQVMERSQAGHVHKSYSNFVSLILNGKESEIDYKKIYNVGEKRLTDYITKIKQNLRAILFCPVCAEWGLIDFDKVSKLAMEYEKPSDLEQALKDNPYDILISKLDMPFKKSDRLILEKHEELLSSAVRCEAGCIEILNENENEGDTRIEYDILEEFVKDLIPECKPYIVDTVKSSPKIYYDEATKYSALKQTYDDECYIAEQIKHRVKHPVDSGMEWEKFRDITGFEFTEEQTEILKIANEESIGILTGGSGVGKTYSIKALVLMLEHYQKDYIMLAPTGIASKRIRESTGRKASTIHMFLASDSVGARPDFVIVDEMSMVGVNLFASLLRTLPKESKIILVCDNAQLASISCGNIVQDILDSGIVKRANLTKVFRYGDSGIATVATDTRLGKPVDTSNAYPDYTYIPINKDPVEQIVEAYTGLMAKGYTKDDITILCPYNKSNIGSYVINDAIQDKFNQHEFSGVEYKRDNHTIQFRIGDKIINKKNNYSMPKLDYDEYGELAPDGVFFVANGDMGTIRDVQEEDDKKYFVVEFDNGLAKVAKTDITHLLLGTTISIHSSQGSQNKAVIVVIAKGHKRMLTRNLLYVSVSRAQEKLILIGDKEVIDECMGLVENNMRDTFLKELLKNS